MEEFKKVNRCHHCGAILQTENKNSVGYIDQITIDKYPEGLLLCNKCYKNARFNVTPSSNQMFDDDFKKIVETIKEKNSLVVYVVDVFSFEGSFVKELNNKLKGLDILALANKADLLPKNINEEHTINYVKDVFSKANLKVIDCLLVSINTMKNINSMYEKIISLSKGRDVYFIGAVDSGKSALIKEFLKLYKNNTKKLITMYTFKNTNLRGYKIPINHKQYIYETPGLYVSNSILDKIDKKSILKIIPDSTLKPIKKTITKNNMLLLGGLAIIQLLSEEKVTLTTYVNSKISVNKTISGRLSNLEYKFKKGILTPFPTTISSLYDFDCFDIQLENSGTKDIGILGLGWISFEANKQKFRIFVPRGTFIYIDEGKIEYVNK